ncbi:hypothetical protein [Paraburkholderia sp. D1E]|uniref:hypothetical protein n=1 Tax=Paraburkholderia sp. D1E TaxID=3461398 RepID=UPI00404556E6
MAGALINITDAGRAALVAPGNAGTNAHKIVEIGLSTALFDATDHTLKKLPNELKRIATFAGENVAFDTIHVTLRDDTPDQYKLYGLGLYLENGVLFGVYCQNAADGPIMEKSPAALLLLSADMQFTTIDATKLVFGDASFTNPPATTERQGVVELATQAEVNAGTDDLRAITPKTAAARYAALTGATFSGQVVLPEGSVLVPSLTFDKDGAPDTGLYHISDGSFGITSNGKSVARFTAGGTVFDKNIQVAAGVRALFGTATDDGTNLVQIGGNASTRGVHTFGYGATVGWVTADATMAYFRSNGHVSVGSESTMGFLDLFAGNAARARILPSGRMLVGTSTDDGASTLQVNGIVKGIAAVRALYASNGGGTGQTSLMLTREGAPADERQWELLFGSQGTLSLRSVNDAYSAGKSAIEITRPTGNGVNLGVMKLMNDGGRVLIGTSTDDGNTRLQIAGSISVNRVAGEGQLALGGNDGYFYGNAAQCGWYSPTKGAFRYDFTNQNLFVGASNNAVWHAGNLVPLDANKGGTLNNDLAFAAGKRLWLSEGSALLPSLTFINDGAPDTGLFHIADGVFGITNNGKETVRFGTESMAATVSLTSSATVSANTLGAFRSTGNIGGAFADWNGTNKRIPGLQIDAFDPAAAYLGMRWTRWGGRHFAAIEGYEGGLTTTEPSIVFHLDGRNNAWSFGRNEIARGAGGSVWGSWNFDPAAKLNLSGGTMTGRLTLTASGSYGELGLRSSDNTFMYMRGRASGGGMEWVNSDYNSVPASMDNTGNFRVNGTVSTGGGGSWLAMDGNVYGGIWGGYLSNWLNSNISSLQNNINGKAAINARVQYDSGLVEFAEANGRTVSIVDLPAPYVVTGLRVAVGTDINRIWQRGVVLRNQ